MAPVTPTGTKSSEEVGEATETPAAEATSVAESIVKTTQSLNIRLKET